MENYERLLYANQLNSVETKLYELGECIKQILRDQVCSGESSEKYLIDLLGQIQSLHTSVSYVYLGEMARITSKETKDG